ncbi:MAG: ATP-binding protein [Aureispira sp.]
MKENISFNVSARAARLIGRENVANAEGALIELIKNCYDADADFCIICIDVKYKAVPTSISYNEYKSLSTLNSNIIEQYFSTENNRYELSDTIDELNFSQLRDFFQKVGSIYIIDNGHGMDSDIIKNHWMTIGTNNKEIDITTNKGRVKTGAKGIGRFALDRLGSLGQMWTKEEDDSKTCLWEVNWNDFEAKGQILGKIFAQLSKQENFSFINSVKEIIGDQQDESVDFLLKKWITNSGTIIKISSLRDLWGTVNVKKLHQNLSMLIPPKEERIFDILVLDSLSKNSLGLVQAPSYDDFDYKIQATCKDQLVTLTIYRDEFRVDEFIENDFFLTHKNIKKKEQYSKEVFANGKYQVTRKLSEYAIGSIEAGHSDLLEGIGDFDFTFYFLKRALSKKDSEKYKQKSINSSRRTQWLKGFRGIRIFRDNFRVRPYGEKDTSSFDWLDLGLRASSATSQPSLSGWKVRPNMVSGIINISRLSNLFFADKSSREGLQENAVFSLFKEVIVNIIKEFEKDRYPIMKALADLAANNNEIEENKNKADNIAKSHKKNSNNKKTQVELEEEKEVLIDAYQATKEENKGLENENKILRALASSGLIVSAFTHELKTLQNNLSDRMDELVELTKAVTDPNTIRQLPEYKNPFILIDDVKEDDSRLKLWLEFAIDSIKKDKRRRKKVELITYFKRLERNWSAILSAKQVDLVLNTGIWEEIYWKGYTIDLDSIFNNLIVNSTEAFKRRGFKSNNRKITIEINRTSDVVEITYSDNGPGLDEDIKEPNDILEFNFTTKRNDIGEVIGTGIGMWLVNSVINDYNGQLLFQVSRPGFRVKLIIPVLK